MRSIFSFLQTKLGSRPDSAQRQYCRSGTASRGALLILFKQYWSRSCPDRRKDSLKPLVFYHGDWHTHGISLMYMIAVSIYKLNIFNVLCFIHKCKYNLNPWVFGDVFVWRTRNKYSVFVYSIVFHIMEPTFRTDINFRKFNFQW